MSNTEAKKTTAVAKKQSDITNMVLQKIEAFEKSGELRLPEDYSAPNAIKAAQLVLMEVKTRDGKPALEACSQTSIANSLLKMVIFGLSPLKQQLYFVPYGDKLECTVSYTGEILLAKRYANLKEITANIITDGEIFEFEIDSNTGRRKLIKHAQTLESIGSEKIVGAYAIYQLNDGTTDMDIMTMEQIKTSWAQGSSGSSPAHKKFAGEMAKRTIIKRAIKLLLRSSDDATLFKTQSREDIDVVKGDVDHDVKENANHDILDIEDVAHEEVVDKETGEVTEKETQKTSEKLF